MKLDDKRWASAYIDGEGYLQFENVKYKRKRIEVTGTDFAPIRLLHIFLEVEFISLNLD